MAFSRLLAGMTVAFAATTASAQHAEPRLADGAMKLSPAPRDEPFRIKRIDHTGITVSSLDESLKFWVDTMGFRHLYTWTFENGPFIEQLVGVPGAAMRLAMIEAPGHMIELLEYTAPDDRKIYKPRSSDVGSVHVAFYVENIDALLARIASVGWLPVANVQTVESGDRKGLRLIYVKGPDGVTLEFLQLPEDAPK
jgi:catechol 2,3-dioxygenase-like lactoylglutathione lyase family enzyme